MAIRMWLWHEFRAQMRRWHGLHIASVNRQSGSWYAPRNTLPQRGELEESGRPRRRCIPRSVGPLARIATAHCRARSDALGTRLLPARRSPRGSGAGRVHLESRLGVWVGRRIARVFIAGSRPPVNDSADQGESSNGCQVSGGRRRV